MAELTSPAIAGTWLSLKPRLSNPILETLESLEFTQMTPVQAATIPLFLQNKDVVVEAVTGSGKTLAFLIPIIEIIKRREIPLKKKQIGAIVIEPTRELAKQVADVLDKLLVNIQNQSYLLLTGGKKLIEDVKIFRERGSPIIIGTPGRLEEFVTKIHDFVTSELEVLVLDEADQLLDLGFEKSLNTIISKLPKQRRTGLFSATMTEGLNQLVRVGLRNAVKVMVKVENKKSLVEQKTPAQLENYYMICESEQKFTQIVKFFEGKDDKKIIIYFATCACVDYYYKLFQSIPSLKTFQFFSLHGKIPQSKRTAIYDKFLELPQGVLVCSDVAARGLDIPDVDYVIQYDPPQDPKAFVHRCGRTARIGKSGIALILLRVEEDTYIEFMKNRKVPLLEIPSVPLDQCFDAVSFIRKLVVNDRDLYEQGMKAFVSFIRHYKEHQCNYIFNFKELDIGKLAESFCLIKLPKMPEIGNKKIEFAELKIDVSKIKYKNKLKEKQRQQKLKTQQALKLENSVVKRPKENVAWSKTHEKKDLKRKRREIKIAKKEYENKNKEQKEEGSSTIETNLDAQPSKKQKTT